MKKRFYKTVYRYAHPFKICGNLVIRYSEHGKSKPLQIGCSFGVPRHSIRLVMLGAVRLYHKSSPRTVEIHDEASKYLLSAEFDGVTA